MVVKLCPAIWGVKTNFSGQGKTWLMGVECLMRQKGKDLAQSNDMGTDY
jgi:hypothetical protein